MFTVAFFALLFSHSSYASILSWSTLLTRFTTTAWTSSSPRFEDLKLLLIVRFVNIVFGSKQRDERGADNAADLEGELRRHLARRDESADQRDLPLAGEEKRPRRQAITTRKLADVASERSAKYGLSYFAGK